MKKLILFLLIGLVLISFVVAEECEVAWPQFGVIECDVVETTAKLEDYPSNCQSEEPYWCEFNFECAGKVHCNIYGMDFDLKCSEGNWAPYLEIYKDGSSTPSIYNLKDNPPPNIEEFQTVLIKSYCLGTILGWNKEQLENLSKIELTYQNKYLYDDNPDHTRHLVPESVGCIPNGIMAKEGYLNQLPERWVDSDGQIKDNKPSDATDYLPTNMEEGETYSYLYGWREVSEINLIHDKNGELAGYCGGNLGSRKLLEYQQLSEENNCYIIPTSVKRDVECCYDGDCKWKGENYVCDPTTFMCSESKPCNSDIECQVIGQTTCLDNTETLWTCDLNEVWYPKKGTCMKSTKEVLCCSDDDCGTEEYCNKEEGCKLRYNLENCPSERCCIYGGDYKEKECGSSLQCCILVGSLVGVCEEDCSQVDKEELENENFQGGNASSLSEKSSSTGTIILIVFLILIGGSVAYFVYVKNKKKKLKTKVKKELKTKEKHCTKCGNLLSSKNKFCTKCGKRVLK